MKFKRLSGGTRPPWPALALVSALFLSACADMSGISPEAHLREPASLGLQTGNAASTSIAADWWRGFGDADLNGLIADALANSPSIKVAEARMRRARSVVEVAHAATLPQVEAEVDLSRQLLSANSLYPPPWGGSIFEMGQAQLNGVWEIDFFGKNQAALDAALGAARAAQADSAAARLLLATQITRAWFQLARLNDQAQVAERMLAQRSQTLDLVRERLKAGLDTRLELRQSQGALPEMRQQIESLHEQIALTRNALNALTGLPDRANALKLPTLAALQALPSTQQLPADLLGRRPDIVAARWRVEAATKDVSNAKAKFYPNVNITAFLGLSSLEFDSLLRKGSEQWGIGPAISLPIFDAGRLRANLRAKSADLDAAVESYNGSVIEAVHEVQDALKSAQSIAAQQAEQRTAQAAAESAYDIAQQRYKAGLTNYLQVLASETAVLAQRRQAVDLAARALDNQASLARALGGGFVPIDASQNIAKNAD